MWQQSKIFSSHDSSLPISHGPLAILICWFDVQGTFLIIISVHKISSDKNINLLQNITFIHIILSDTYTLTVPPSIILNMVLVWILMCLKVNRIEVSECADASTDACVCVCVRACVFESEGVGVEEVSVLDSGVDEVMRLLKLTVTPSLHTHTHTHTLSLSLKGDEWYLALASWLALTYNATYTRSLEQRDGATWPLIWPQTVPVSAYVYQSIYIYYFSTFSMSSIWCQIESLEKSWSACSFV